MKKLRLRKISRHTLAQDLLFTFVVKAGHKCFRCGGELRRKDFTIEHIIPWRKSNRASALFFDIENVAYSHAACNYSAAHRPPARSVAEDKKARAARKKAAWLALDVPTRKKIRRLKYEKYGC